MTETEAPATTATASRGRPRPQTTIDRDNAVLTALQEAGAAGVTREVLAQKFPDMKPSHVYLSLFRLRRDGVAQRAQAGGSHVWSAVAPQNA